MVCSSFFDWLTERVTSHCDTVSNNGDSSSLISEFGKVGMDSLAIRCRHEQVNWVGPNRCECASCRKFGHWFEEAGLVMWYRGRPESNPADTQIRVDDQAAVFELQAF